MNRPRRAGLTLIEVLLTMAITAMVLAALTQLQHSGARAATGATLTAEASVLCQSEMDAWLAGNRSSAALDAIEALPVDDNWYRRFTLQSIPNSKTRSTGSELWLLTVDVYRGRQLQPEYSLSRWIASARSGGQP